MKSIIPYLFYQLPECYLLIMAALGLIGVKYQVRRLIPAGLAFGSLAIPARILLLRYGIHTPLILIALVLILAWVFRLSLSSAITGCFLSYFLLLQGETLVIIPVLRLSGLTFQEVLANPWIHVGFGYLSATFLIVAAIVCRLTGFALIRASEEHPTLTNQ